MTYVGIEMTYVEIEMTHVGIEMAHVEIEMTYVEMEMTYEWTEFVESAEEGVVVFTLGSQISIGEDLEKATKFVRAFARLPQKVIMRYVGEPLNGVGENTKLSSWIPQNDLLGHPNTKAFIGHGGINGINEAIYHGVPFIGVAALGDQAENIGRLVNKGMAIALNLHSFSEDDVYNAVKKVIEDSRYKENAARLSSIQKDTPMSPGDTAVFWIEHILKFGGDHLKPASLQLNFVQYFLLDIVAFVLVVFAFVIIVSKLVIQQVCKMCCKPTKKKQL
ncbi:UDP-glucuronosyltransferase 2B31-like [Saccoglossus kowalevskii]|uniref:UDP-glucuronosyltransferase 2B31-like n=1 Tax=Saccoglossus kowalevskii TaxID=10224 RepID=A0ABM0GKS3_SACKO|nr:PREDICTED: UDP-glucuronosyltransferase 2B31-like [Saccoglossus kowalevskii]